MLDVSCFDFRDPQETDEDYLMCAFLYSFYIVEGSVLLTVLWAQLNYYLELR
jgi:hypothetical protein